MFQLARYKKIVATCQAGGDFVTVTRLFSVFCDCHVQSWDRHEAVLWLPRAWPFCDCHEAVFWLSRAILRPSRGGSMTATWPFCDFLETVLWLSQTYALPLARLFYDCHVGHFICLTQLSNSLLAAILLPSHGRLEDVAEFVPFPALSLWRPASQGGSGGCLKHLSHTCNRERSYSIQTLCCFIHCKKYTVKSCAEKIDQLYIVFFAYITGSLL